MVDDMVMRSVYFRPSEDAQLRQLAHELNVSKSDLIRAAASIKLEEWLKSNDRARILEDVERGRRDEEAIRSGRRGRRGGSGASGRSMPISVVEPPSQARPAPKAQAAEQAAAEPSSAELEA